MSGVELLSHLGLEPSCFDTMCGLYRDWNAKINVISRKDVDCVFEHHILHSLCIAAYLKARMPQEYIRWTSEGEKVRVLDLGCGGGFPGLPLAMCFPQVQFTLCDSIGKKITVASAVAASLGLLNVRCVNARAESLEGQWDWVVSRAVAPLPKLLEWSRGKYGRGLLCLKGGDISEEIGLCPQIGGKLRQSIDLWDLWDLWPIEKCLDDPYYSGKWVVRVGE